MEYNIKHKLTIAYDTTKIIQLGREFTTQKCQLLCLADLLTLFYRLCESNIEI